MIIGMPLGQVEALVRTSSVGSLIGATNEHATWIGASRGRKASVHYAGVPPNGGTVGGERNFFSAWTEARTAFSAAAFLRT